MTPYQWIGRGPRCRSGSTLMVMKPTGPGLAGTAAIMRAAGGGMHLEHPIAALRPYPVDAVSVGRQPCGERVGPEVALDNKRRDRVGFQPCDPGEQQLMQRRLPQPPRRGGVRAPQ